MVLVELASVEEAIDAVANLLAMLSQMKSKGSEPLKVERSGAKQQYRKGKSPMSGNANISKLLDTLIERLRHCPSSAGMQQSNTRTSAKIPVPTPAPTSAARAASTEIKLVSLNPVI